MKSDLKSLNKSQREDEVFTSDEDIIKSSQTKKEKSKNVSKKSKSISKKKNDTSFYSPKKKLDIYDISEIDDITVKEEWPDMIDNIDNESIEMSHNLNGILFNTQYSNLLQFSPPIICKSAIEETIKEEDESVENLMQDPLSIDESCKDEEKEKSTVKTKDKAFALKINSKIKTLSKKDSVENSRYDADKSSFSDNSYKKKNNKNIKKKSLTLKKEDEVFSVKLVQKLQKLNIQLQHEVPPQHQIEKDVGVKSLNAEQLKKFSTYGPIKRGQYTTSEIKTIMQNWKDFCKIHNWDEKEIKPFLYSRHKGKYYLNIEERKKFVQFLANGLPWRPLCSVYYKFKNFILFNANVGKFTAKEDKIIMKYMIEASDSQLRKTSSEVADLLNRKTTSIWHRFRKLSQEYPNISKTNNNTLRKNKTVKYIPKSPFRKVHTKVTWSYSLVTEFIDALVQSSTCNLDQLKNKTIDQDVWNQVEEITRVHRKTVENFWYSQLHMQIFCPMPVYLNDLKIKLIQFLYEKEIKKLEDIKWEIVCLNFDGITSIFLSKLFSQLIKIAETNVESSDMKDILQYLYHKYILELEDKTTDIILPKLYCKNNKIINVDKGTENKIPNRTTKNPLNE